MNMKAFVANYGCRRAALVRACRPERNGSILASLAHVDTAHFCCHFADKHRAQADVVAGIAETVYPRLTGWLRWRPESRVTWCCSIRRTSPTASLPPLPFNYNHDLPHPARRGRALAETAPWLELVLTHELTHVVHLDKASRGPLVCAGFFGRIPFVFPNALEPGWVTRAWRYSESDPAKQFSVEDAYPDYSPPQQPSLWPEKSEIMDGTQVVVAVGPSL